MDHVRHDVPEVGARVLYAFATFLAAALLFLIEPMAAKALLPRLGGSAGVWTASLVFYQTVLLAGYGYAHLLARRLSLRRMAIVHAVVTCLAALLLPWHAPAAGGPGDVHPSLWVLGKLASWVGVPFFVLAASGPLLQRWLAARPGGRDPYSLYAVSNASSLAALLGYPLLVERHLPLAGPAGTADPSSGLTQNALWSGVFSVFAALSMVCAVIAVRTPPMETTSVSGASETSPSWRQRAVWIAFAFVPAAAVLGTTQALTTDVASVPLLWVLPLAIYLVTFVLAFAGKTRVPTRAAFGVVAVLVLGVAASQWNTQRPDPRVALPLYLATLFAIGLLGHGRLAEQRPPVRDLTDFYLSIAAGGALGSVFCGLVAPLIFSSVAEYPLVLVLGCLLGIRLGPRQAGRRGRVVDLMLPLASAGLLAVALVAAGATNPVAGDDRLTVRTFFGVLRVKDKPGPPFSPKAGPNAGQEVRLPMHELFHGTTLHGVQVTRPSQARLPTSYYHPSGPIGRVFAALRAGPESGLLSDVGVVGLGVGSLAAYAAAGERFTFFEIDPAVVRIARDPELFSYLRDCAGRAEVVVEDGRIALAREPDGRFGLLVIDAFSSDAVPVHLLTREALALVLDKLRPGGLAAFHVSSSFFDLAPVLAEAAADLGKEGLYWFDTEISPVEVVTAKEASRWVIVAREPAALALLAGSGSWMPLASVRRTEGGPWLWTDRYSSPLAALRR